MTSLRRILWLAVELVAATALLGWWGVPLGVALWTPFVVREGRARHVGRDAALAAALAWLALLAYDAARGPALSLARTLGGVMGLPPLAIVAVTLALPALLAWASATVVAALAVRGAAPRAAADVPRTPGLVRDGELVGPG